MTTNIIKKIPRTLLSLQQNSNLINSHHRNFTKLYRKTDHQGCTSLFTTKPYARENGLKKNVARYSSLPMKEVAQRRSDIGGMSLGMKALIPPPLPTDHTSKNLCSCQPPLLDPRGKVAVITGGSRGIGLSIVEELLCQGAKVFIIDENREFGECTATRLASIYGWDNIQFAQGDVSNFESFEACVHLAACKYNRLDIMVNNSGILSAFPRDKLIEINYKAVVFGTRLGFKYMGADQGKNGGVVLNTASICGLIGLPGSPYYGATKHAVVGAVMSYGDNLTFDKTCVRVCAMCPGVTLSSMTTNVDDIPCEHFRDGIGERNVLKDWINTHPNQPCNRVGPAAAHIIRNGPNGSIWVVEDSELYQVLIPDYHDIECPNTRVKDLEC
ncbi:3-oxoacyl-[acyl-carrier-protein] reductase FabG-like isoform X1 [Ischnura elegans]|uniref:3-oxoacyl-[acyl-carrier-protein] reductase FabG-like isoform X1 n=1 Tax=Ischnura elegans TaxID=197161 RepID=UPI001ED88C5B|nr:3-oxoacyl-[acyl-carrier-protein] reductase FabG-like isoform X1 [Ischnura elegans]